MREEKRLDVNLSLTITEAGEPFNSTTVTWNDVPYSGVLEIEKRLIAFLSGMQEFGMEQVTRAGSGQPFRPPQ